MPCIVQDTPQIPDARCIFRLCVARRVHGLTYQLNRPFPLPVWEGDNCLPQRPCPCSAQVLSLTCNVKWHRASSAETSENAIHLEFIWSTLLVGPNCTARHGTGISPLIRRGMYRVQLFLEQKSTNLSPVPSLLYGFQGGSGPCCSIISRDIHSDYGLAATTESISSNLACSTCTIDPSTV